MITVISCVWFTSGQEMLDIIDVSIDEFKADILSQVDGPKPAKHFGWDWIVAAMQKHDPCEFFWTVKGEFKTFDEAEKHMLSLQKDIQFPFQSHQHIKVHAAFPGCHASFFWIDDIEHVTLISKETGMPKICTVSGLHRIFCDTPSFHIIKKGSK